MAGCKHRDALDTVHRDLHDQIGSPLAGLIMEAELARQLIRQEDAKSADAVLAAMRRDLAELMALIRLLCSRPEAAQRAWDVERSLREMLGRMNRALADRLSISLDADPRLCSVPDRVSGAAFWIVREAVTNVIKHSGARHCAVTLRVEDRGLRVLVTDDGTARSQPGAGSGSGLSNMRARAVELGGWCVTEQGSPHGFVVSAFLPIEP